MTDQEWLQCDDPERMIAFRLKKRSRKMRLAAVAACRLFSGLLFDERSEVALEVAERFADGLATDEERKAALEKAGPAVAAMGDAYSAAVEAPGPTSEEGDNFMYAFSVAEAAQAAVSEEPEVAFSYLPASRYDFYFAYSANILRDVFGSATRVAFDPRWLTPTVTALAGEIYDERKFDKMPLLAKALEDAGCEERTILEHCRLVDHYGLGQHVRGCWVLDLVLDRE
jgi:hypothetical protein